MGGMSTATLSQRRKRRNREKVRGKTKGGGGSNEHCDYRSEGDSGGMQQTGRERTRGGTRGWEHERTTIEGTREDGYESPLIRATE